MAIKENGINKPGPIVPEVFNKAFEERIDEKVSQAVVKNPIIRLKPLPQILDEMDANINFAIEAAHRSEQASKAAREAALAATKVVDETATKIYKAADASAKAAEKKALAAIKAAGEAAAAAEISGHEITKAIKQVDGQQNTLLKKIAELENRLKKLEINTSPPELVVLQEVSRLEAINMIEKMFKTGKTYYYSDVARKLHLDLELVVNICDELIKEGRIEVAETT